jgi:hypothetical protein
MHSQTQAISVRATTIMVSSDILLEILISPLDNANMILHHPLKGRGLLLGVVMSSVPAWKTERSIMVRAYEDLDTSLGFFPDKRPLSNHIRYGMLVVDKPPGPTSHELIHG